MGADLFGPTDIPRMVGALSDFRGVDLTAEEGFLLSRIDGHVNVGALLTLVAWDREKTMALLESLLRKHVLNFDRKEIGERVFGTAAPSVPFPPPSSSSNSSSSPDRNRAAPASSASQVLPPVSSGFDKNQIEKVADLEVARCLEILEWEAAVGKATSLFQIFGLPDGADPRSVKRQYRSMAMSFHPDKFFRKEIGGYRVRIETTWKRVQEAYEVLQDDKERAAYEADSGNRPTPAPPTKVPGMAVDPVAAGPGRAPAGVSKPLVLLPLDDFEKGSEEDIPLVQGQRVDPKPSFESALARKMKAEMKDRMDKGKRQFEQAQADFQAGRFSQADSNAKLAMQFDPQNPEFKNWYASVLPKMEEGIVSGILRKGELCEASGDSKQALENYEHATRLFPDNLDANLALGWLLMRRYENPKIAKDCLQKVVNKRPKHLEALVGLARAMRMLGMIKNAQRVLDQAKALAPKDARVLEEVKEMKRVT